MLISCLILFKTVLSKNALTSWRLSRDLIPFHYTLHLLPLFIEGEISKAIRGYIQIDLECNEDTDTIVLNSHEINIEKSSVKVYSRIYREQLVPYRTISFDKENQLVSFHLKHKLKKGGAYSISMKFVSNLNDVPKGFYKWHYTEDGIQRLVGSLILNLFTYNSNNELMSHLTIYPLTIEF